MSDSNAPKVRCQDCGFLAVQDRFSRGLIETERSMRETGEPPIHPQWKIEWVERTPICFVQAFPLHREAKGLPAHNGFLDVIQRERDCKPFAAWQQGSSPQDHKDMIDAREQRQWQDEQRRKDRAWELECRREDRRQFRLTLVIGLIIVPILAALLNAAGAWLVAKIERATADEKKEGGQ